MKIRLWYQLLVLSLLIGCGQIPSEKNGSQPSDQITAAASPLPTWTPGISECLKRAVFGDLRESLYVLPYPEGKTYQVGQTYCLSFGNHRNQLAYDFDMNIGEAVSAARAGTVMKVDDHFADDGSNPGDQEYNHVMIQHEDGTVAFYAHLLQNSVMVAEGDNVVRGQILARVGFSGMPNDAAPCLHFGVYAAWPPVEGEDVPVNFRNAEGTLDPRGGLFGLSMYKALPVEP